MKNIILLLLTSLLFSFYAKAAPNPLEQGIRNLIANQYFFQGQDLEDKVNFYKDNYFESPQAHVMSKMNIKKAKTLANNLKTILMSNSGKLNILNKQAIAPFKNFSAICSTLGVTSIEINQICKNEDLYASLEEHYDSFPEGGPLLPHLEATLNIIDTLSELPEPSSSQVCHSKVGPNEANAIANILTSTLGILDQVK